MSLYSSREPFNDDPEWFCGKCGGKSWEHAQSDSRCIWEPVDLRRPEYNRPQNNPTNPGLTELRKHLKEGGPKNAGPIIRIRLKSLEWAMEEHLTGWQRFTPETLSLIEHTRKVLTRLASLKKEES